MSTASHSGSATAVRPGLDLLVGALASAALAFAAAGLIGRDAGFVAIVCAFYAGVAATVRRSARRARRSPDTDGLPGPGLGWANRVTLARLVIAIPVAGVALSPSEVTGLDRWLVIVVATLALCLDGVDGWIARRTGTESEFGARFDMETDAGLLMLLSVLVWRSGQAGIWVLLIGAMRYIFVAAGAFLPAMRGELPASFRRKVVCVVQGVALLLALAPFLPVTGGIIVSAIGLIALTWSFGVDTAWLLRKPLGTQGEHSYLSPSKKRRGDLRHIAARADSKE